MMSLTNSDSFVSFDTIVERVPVALANLGVPKGDQFNMLHNYIINILHAAKRDFERTK